MEKVGENAHSPMLPFPSTIAPAALSFATCHNSDVLASATERVRSVVAVVRQSACILKD
jgi:hypothetical protein